MSEMFQVVKIENGHYQVWRGNNPVSIHSSREGAERAIERMKQTAAAGDAAQEGVG